MAAVVAVRATMARAAMQGGLLTHCAPRSAASADLPAGGTRPNDSNASGCISLGLFFGLLMDAQALETQGPCVFQTCPNNSHLMRRHWAASNFLAAPMGLTQSDRAERLSLVPAHQPEKLPAAECNLRPVQRL